MKSELYYPKIKLDIISDKDHNIILELAEECKADFIITGNTNDFTIPEYKDSKIGAINADRIPVEMSYYD